MNLSRANVQELRDAILAAGGPPPNRAGEFNAACAALDDPGSGVGFIWVWYVLAGIAAGLGLSQCKKVGETAGQVTESVGQAARAIGETTAWLPLIVLMLAGSMAYSISRRR